MLSLRAEDLRRCAVLVYESLAAPATNTQLHVVSAYSSLAYGGVKLIDVDDYLA